MPRKLRTSKTDWIGHRGPVFLVTSRKGKDTRGNTTWLAKCDCGNEFVITTAALGRPQGYRSCGCWRASQEAQRGSKRPQISLGPGIASRNKLFSNYKRQAHSRGYSFDLTLEDALHLFKGDCYYCGISPCQSFTHRTCNGPYIYNGIDRRDNNLGYTCANSVSCCGTCNMRKNDSSEAEFLLWIQKVHSHFILKGVPA